MCRGYSGQGGLPSLSCSTRRPPNHRASEMRTKPCTVTEWGWLTLYRSTAKQGPVLDACQSRYGYCYATKQLDIVCAMVRTVPQPRARIFLQPLMGPSTLLIDSIDS